MGRLIPAGTGMKYYRNVKVAYDPTENQKQQDEFDELADIRGGIEIPMPIDIPGIEPEDFDEDDAIGMDDIDAETEEVFDIDEAMKIDLDADDEI